MGAIAGAPREGRIGDGPAAPRNPAGGFENQSSLCESIGRVNAPGGAYEKRRVVRNRAMDELAMQPDELLVSLLVQTIQLSV